jgi:hypothetical protein
MFITMAALHLTSPFSSPCYGIKIVYNYGLGLLFILFADITLPLLFSGIIHLAAYSTTISFRCMTGKFSWLDGLLFYNLTLVGWEVIQP